MMCDDVIQIFYIGTQAAFDCGSLLLFYFVSFSTQATLLLSYESRKGGNSVTGNVQVHIHIFNKGQSFISHGVTTLPSCLTLWMFGKQCLNHGAIFTHS